MRRRAMITAAVSCGLVVTAGCTSVVSDADDSVDAPDPATPPDELLPAHEDYSLLEQESTSPDGAEVGARAEYRGPYMGDYTVEIVRWPSEDDTDVVFDGLYDDWDIIVTNGVFTFAGNNPPTSRLETLMATSSGLGQTQVEDA